MVDLGKPDRYPGMVYPGEDPGTQGCFRFDEVDPGWVAPKPWGHYEPFHELHGIRRIQSAPGLLPVHWSSQDKAAGRPEAASAICLRPEAASVPAQDSLGHGLHKQGKARGRSSSWAGATWHMGFLHAKRCLAECEIDLRYTITFLWAFSGDPVMCRHNFMHRGEPTCFRLPGYMTWHGLAWLLFDATGLKLSRLQVMTRTGCRLRWLQYPHHSPPLRAIFGSDIAPTLELVQISQQEARKLLRRDRRERGAGPLVCEHGNHGPPYFGYGTDGFDDGYGMHDRVEDAGTDDGTDSSGSSAGMEL